MRRNKDFILAGVLAIVLSFALFGNGIGGDFVFDDTIVIVGNPLIGDPSKFTEIFTTPYFAYQPRPGLYRPLTIASHSLNAFVFGQSPISFHIVNILLHALASFLVFVFIYLLSDRITASLGSLIFMFLPIHVEAVTSIVGRAEILSFIFTLGALLLSIKKRYIFASLLFFMGLLSKETAIAFLPIFLFLDFFWHKKTAKSVFKSLLFLVPSLGVYALLRYVALGQYFLKNDATPIYNPIKFAPFLSGIWTSFKVFYLYIQKSLYPISLSADYSFNQIPLVGNFLSSIETMLGIVVLIGLLFLLFRSKNLFVKLGIVIFIASYFVVSNWVFKTGTIMAERLMYMPSLGLAMLAAVIMQNLKLKAQNKVLFFALHFSLCALFLWYGWLVIDRNKDWLSNKNLYESSYVAAPKSVVNQTNKAYLDFVEGKYPDAELRLKEVIVQAPEHVPALNLAAQNYNKLRELKKAEELWKEAIRLRDDYLRAYLSLGILYYENGYFASAEKVLTEAVEIYPRWSEVLFLALAKISLDKNDEAIQLISAYSGTNPAEKELKFALGLAYFKKGETDKAFQYFEQVKDPKVKMEDFLKTFQGSEVIILGEF